LTLPRQTFTWLRQLFKGSDPASDPARLAALSDGPGGGADSSASGRKFRPDVEGLRALAILLVVLYHANVPGVRGGFVGVDVFFVISGFLITGLLVSEAGRSGRVSILRFYARRARRILPAATLVIILTVLASYHYLGFLVGNQVADDGKWATVFLANIHFASLGTNYFSSEVPPSPLQHMWSLSVEEQFYAVWPLLVLLVTAAARRFSLRVCLGAVLGVIIVASFAWSVIETDQNGVWAYFSPLTRGWELAAGGLVAVAAPLVERIPRMVAIALGGIGLIGVIVSGTTYSSHTTYPGAAVALPVLGTAAVIVAGSAVAGSGVELLLRLRPVQWLGARSYSLYLWHWPFLVIAAEHAGKTLSVGQNLLWVLAALGASMISYRLIENPVRRAGVLIKRPVVSIALGLCLIGASLGVAQLELQNHSGPNGIGPVSTSLPIHAAIVLVGMTDGVRRL
jgi:peptidoglycan/LPS O-acetylase OafA/YrhL